MAMVIMSDVCCGVSFTRRWPRTILGKKRGGGGGVCREDAVE